MRLVVTGASGFVGRHVVETAASQGVDVVGIVRSEKGVERVAVAGGRPARIAGFEDPAFAAAFTGADAVVHLAQIGAERSGVTYTDTNVVGTRRVIAAAYRARIRRVVHFSGLGVARYGQAPRCTNPYFLSKLLAEAALFESGLDVAVFRPSYIVGPGDSFVPGVVRDMARGEVEVVGDGSARSQPVSVRDAAACVLAAAGGARVQHRVFDLVGPEPVSLRVLVERTGRIAREQGKAGAFGLREVPVADADRLARTGGYRGMLPDELDCLLCDEVSDHGPLEALLGRRLTPLDDALAFAVGCA
ncbi:MAG TPA: NAD(P)-dependent oxidoreductase [Vicinamibacteria bacterium]|nr:NAD(P)-dependent oxidoreductase [Vicinamibacteria bacterium]